MTSVPWIQSGWGEVLSAHRRSCHWGGKPEESWEKMIVMETSAAPRTPDPPKIGLCHLSIRAPGSRLSSTNPALKSGGVWAKSIFQWTPCDVPSQSWMPILSSSSWSPTSYRSDNGVDRGRKYFEKQKGTEPRRETEGDRASPHFHNLGCSQQKATLHLLAMQCNALQCNARANHAQPDWIQWDFTQENEEQQVFRRIRSGEVEKFAGKRAPVR